MSLRRAIKAQGLGNFLKLGLSIATSAKVAPAPVPENESLRAARVSETGLIGRDVSAQFEIFTETAKLITGCEKAMLNLLDGACQYTISGAGENFDPLLGVPQTMTFCQYALLSPEPVLVPDAGKDPRFADTPLTKPPLNCRSYAGFPLNTSDGVVLGTLCAIDSAPRSLTRPDPHDAKAGNQCSGADPADGRAKQSHRLARGNHAWKVPQFAPEGTLDELTGFLDFCARGTPSK